MTYKVVRAESLERLEEFVNQNLLLGYELQGGVCAIQQLCDKNTGGEANLSALEDRGVVYLQALRSKGLAE